MKIYLGMPCYSGVHPEVVRNIVSFDLDSQGKKNELVLHFPQTSSITLSRNMIMREALKQNADWIIQWDNDIQIKSDDFFYKMTETAYKFGAPVVGLPCRLKDPGQIIYNFADKKGKEYINYKELPQEPKEIDVIGTGFMLINAKWIKENWPIGPWFSFIDTETGVFPEDWNFCEKVKERRGRIMVDPRMKTTHWGQMGFTF